MQDASTRLRASRLALDQEIESRLRPGPGVVGWRERGVLPRRVKLAALGGIGLGIVMACLVPMPAWLALALALAAGIYAWWIWRWPEA